MTTFAKPVQNFYLNEYVYFGRYYFVYVTNIFYMSLLYLKLHTTIYLYYHCVSALIVAACKIIKSFVLFAMIWRLRLSWYCNAVSENWQKLTQIRFNEFSRSDLKYLCIVALHWWWTIIWISLWRLNHWSLEMS